MSNIKIEKGVMKYILAAISVIIFAAFLSTAPPTVYIGDSGEIAASAYTLGVGHPPGYSLYIEIAKISTYIPAGDIAFRINMLSTFLAILVFLAFYRTSLYFIKLIFQKSDEPAAEMTAVITALIYMFSYIFWFEAIHAKGGIYVLTQLVEILSIYYCTRFVYEGEKKYFYMTSFLIGLLPCLHQTTGLIVISILLILIFNMQKIKADSRMKAAGIFLFSLISPYLYLFIRVKAAPVVCWGGITTAGQVISHILRKVYFDFPGTVFTSETEFFKIKSYFIQYWTCYKIGLLFFICGLIILYVKNKKLFFTSLFFIFSNILALFLLTGNSFSSATTYMNSGFYLIVDIMTLFIAGIGIYRIAEYAGEKAGIKKVFCTAFVLILPVYLAVSFYSPNNLSRRYAAYDYADNMLRTMDQKDFLFADEDEAVFNLLYLQYVKGKYKDIKTYDRLGNFLDNSLYKKAESSDVKVIYKQGHPTDEKYQAIKLKATALMEQKEEKEVYDNNPGQVYYASFDEFGSENMEAWPWGIIFKLYKRGDKHEDSSILMKLCTIRDYFNYKQYDFFNRMLLARYFLQYARYAAIKNETNNFEIYLSVTNGLASDSPVILNLIASVYFYNLKDYKTAIEYMEEIMRIDPNDLKSLNVLINMCLAYEPQRAIGWLKYYFYRAPDNQTKNRILVLISKIRDSTAVQKNNSPNTPFKTK